MANPQLENGHLKIANEIWDKLTSANFTGSEFQIILTVIRITWGWRRKAHGISIADFCKITSRPHRTVAEALRSLLKKNILIQVKGGGRNTPSKWSFNKDWETWKLCGELHSKINCAEINSVLSCTYTMQAIAQNQAVNRTVSSCKPLIPEAPASPKDTFKDITDIQTPSESDQTEKTSAKKTRKPDAAYEVFCSEFAEHRNIPYRGCKGDFVQLAGLRQALKCPALEAPTNWQVAIHNYLATPQGKYTLADLCCRFDVFCRGRLDRFGKPDVPAGKSGTIPDLLERGKAAAERIWGKDAPKGQG